MSNTVYDERSKGLTKLLELQNWSFTPSYCVLFVGNQMELGNAEEREP